MRLSIKAQREIFLVQTDESLAYTYSGMADGMSIFLYDRHFVVLPTHAITRKPHAIKKLRKSTRIYKLIYTSVHLPE